MNSLQLYPSANDFGVNADSSDMLSAGDRVMTESAPSSPSSALMSMTHSNSHHDILRLQDYKFAAHNPRTTDASYIDSLVDNSLHDVMLVASLNSANAMSRRHQQDTSASDTEADRDCQVGSPVFFESLAYSHFDHPRDYPILEFAADIHLEADELGIMAADEDNTSSPSSRDAVTAALTPEGGRTRTRAPRRSYVTWSQPTPHEATHQTTTHIDAAMQEKLRAVLTQQPIWSRAALLETLNVHTFDDIKAFNTVILIQSYRLSGGPWRNSYVRMGYDPRQNVEARHFQSVELRLTPKQKEAIEQIAKRTGKKIHGASDTNDVSSPQDSPKTPPAVPVSVRGRPPKSSGSKTPTGVKSSSAGRTIEHEPVDFHFTRLPVSHSCFYQLNEITLDTVQEILTEAKVASQCTIKSGWFTEATLDQIRMAMKRQVDIWVEEAGSGIELSPSKAQRRQGKRGTARTPRQSVTKRVKTEAQPLSTSSSSSTGGMDTLKLSDTNDLSGNGARGSLVVVDVNESPPQHLLPHHLLHRSLDDPDRLNVDFDSADPFVSSSPTSSMSWSVIPSLPVADALAASSDYAASVLAAAADATEASAPI